jgi:gluconate 2-dehydrogenase gamma chain
MDDLTTDVLPAGADSRDKSFRALNSSEAEIVKAAAARILPTTDTPGATEAGAVFYIDRALAEAYPKLRPAYRKGCAALDRQARRRFKRSFVALSAEEQDSLLADFEQGRVTSYPKAADFFALLRRHTMEGVLGEPAYGGNRGLVGWRLVGFPGQQFGYADPYIDRPIDLEPVAIDGPYPEAEALHERKR